MLPQAFCIVFPQCVDCMILVIGDIMLDEYLKGKSTRLAPEGPVPVVFTGKSGPEICLGGAANVAASVSALGEEVSLLGPYGKDRRLDLQRLCRKCGVKLIGEPSSYGNWSGITTIKTRIVDQTGRMLLRLDREGNDPWYGEAMLKRTLKRIRPDVVIFSDYAKGCWTAKNWATILRHMSPNQRRRMVVDSKRNLDNYKGAGLIKCNESEWSRFGGGVMCPRDAHAVVTKGPNGMSHGRWGDCDGKMGWQWAHTKADAHDVYDVTGAGDVVTAVLAVGLARKLPLPQILKSAVEASGKSVTRRMTGVANAADVNLKPSH